ncbi:hypothetical protein MLD38_000838 [Melastoma candidum]|uniref:Uncharacterized protein n=1 Tax=Melastoma candidum TaxID=119954 RepID=A0ACB9SCL1_9MYRT|nr:hypothetical protein MLD38_000838 [Melastoma candidum]
MASITIANAAVCSLKPSDRCFLGSIGLANLSMRSHQAGRSPIRSPKKLIIRAEYSGRSSSGNLFVSGFILGSIVVGALGCVYAPQISQMIAGTDKKDIIRKLPKFVYNEEKALERKRKELAKKIAQLDTAIDGASAQISSEDAVDDDDSMQSNEVTA